jgi:two-component system sensor histidine kinase HydH
VLLSVGLTLTIIYSLLVGWIENSPMLFFFNSFIASFLILTLIEPLRAAVRYFTERLLPQQHRRLRQVLIEGQRNLAGIVDMSSLFQEIILTTERTLQPEWVGLYVLRADGTKYRRVRENHPADMPTPAELLATHPLFEHCRKIKKKGELPILLDQMLESEVDRSTSRTQRDSLAPLISGLRALGSNLLIPIGDDEQMLAFVAVLAPTPPEPWGSNWGLLPIIYPYYEAAAQSMRAMEIYVKSREKERLATLGEMAAGLAHEIRNPLGAIKGAAQFLDPSTDRPESKFLKVIVEETDRLNRVVSQFLEYSKSPQTDLKTMEISPLVSRIVEHVKPGVGNRIAIEFTPSPIAFRAKISPEQIHQVLLNLIQNSVKALEKKVDPRIRIFIEPEGASEAAIVVEDNGTGIRKENLDKLFIPFYTTSPSGTGLGLSISQKIIEAHGGRFEVSTEEGRFSRFSVILPVEEE